MRTTPPDDNVVEVSLFGPGKGESVLVHLGVGRWLVVDSCVDQRERVNPALEYLTALGVDLKQQVRLVVATHAHDDHFAGISDIYAACDSSKFVCSSALTTAEFVALTDADRLVHAGLPVAAYSEYRKIFEIIEERGSRGARPLKYASAQKTLLSDSATEPRAEVIALSPSDLSFTRAQRALRRALPKIDDSKKFRSIDPNELAIALWVEVGNKRLLLGADLTTGPAGCGWQAVLEDFAPDPKASLFKVTHHGSIVGDHEAVWRELLIASPAAILTPFRRGTKQLPDSADRARIYSHTSEAHITASPSMPSKSRAIRREESMIGPLARRVVEPWGRCGQVRARSAINDQGWSIEHFPPAQGL
jgi:hypothetical protein